MDVFETENEFGHGVVKSWASILDDNTREQAERISRCEVVDGHVALMPDAHFGYGPPVGTAMRTRNAVMPYAVGVDIGCGMIAAKTNLGRGDFAGSEGRLLGRIRDGIPSGVGKQHAAPTSRALAFVRKHGLPPGLCNEAVMAAAMVKRHSKPRQVVDELAAKAKAQFGTLGAGNHFVEVCESAAGEVWLVLHSGSRGVGNVLASAHVKLAQASCKRARVELESQEFAWFAKGSPSLDAYLADLAWCQEYAMASRQDMMYELQGLVAMTLDKQVTITVPIVNCHHNYVEQIYPWMWLTRKGAIDAGPGVMGIIPGSMGAKTYIVRGLGCAEAYYTAPHGAGRTMSRGEARRSGDVKAFKERMAGKAWQDRDAERLLDEAPGAYKPVEQVIADSCELARAETSMTQFINYKGVA